MELHHTDEIIEPVDLERESDLVAITCNTPAAAHVYRLAGQLRARGRRVVLGGPHVTAIPSDALRHADALVIGEGELVWPEVVNDFARGRWHEIYRGRPADLRGMKRRAGISFAVDAMDARLRSLPADACTAAATARSPSCMGGGSVGVRSKR